MLEAIKQRQSIRKYQNTPVETEKINSLLEAAMNAPTARNTQEWKFVVITNREALNDMCNLSPYTTMMKEAPCAILVLADLEKAINKEYGLINCAAAIENLIIEAMHQELGTCWCGIAPVEERMNKIREIFNLKGESLRPFNIISLGYPAEGLENKFVDKYDETRVHYETY